LCNSSVLFDRAARNRIAVISRDGQIHLSANERDLARPIQGRYAHPERRERTERMTHSCRQNAKKGDSPIGQGMMSANRFIAGTSSGKAYRRPRSESDGYATNIRHWRGLATTVVAVAVRRSIFRSGSYQGGEVWL